MISLEHPGCQKTVRERQAVCLNFFFRISRKCEGSSQVYRIPAKACGGIDDGRSNDRRAGQKRCEGRDHANSALGNDPPRASLVFIGRACSPAVDTCQMHFINRPAMPHVWYSRARRHHENSNEDVVSRRFRDGEVEQYKRLLDRMAPHGSVRFIGEARNPRSLPIWQLRHGGWFSQQ